MEHITDQDYAGEHITDADYPAHQCAECGETLPGENTGTDTLCTRCIEQATVAGLRQAAPFGACYGH